MIAGWEPQEGGNKQELVLRAITTADDATARRIIEELISLLREQGYLDDHAGNVSRERLLRLLSEQGRLLASDGHIEWQLTSEVPTAVVADVVPQSGEEIVGTEAPVEKVTGADAPAPEVREVASPDLNLLVWSLRRLGSGACRPLIERRKGRVGLKVVDEYDMQDLVEFLLKSLYNDVRSEEPTPSSGGSSSKMDFHLREGRTAVEVKVTRPGRGPSQIKTELLTDINDYRGHPTVNALIAVIYDLADTFGNPFGFEHDLSGRDGSLDTVVVVVPWVGPRGTA
jgi:hypothetical protein